MSKTLGQTDLERLNAWLDGELVAHEADLVTAKVANDPVWARQAAQLQKLGGLLDAWKAPPLRRDLTASILGQTRARRAMPAWVRALAPLAAAAAIFAAVWVYYALTPPVTRPVGAPSVAQSPDRDFDSRLHDTLAPVAESDRQVVQNLDILQNYDVLVSFETLEAIDRLETAHNGI